MRDILFERHSATSSTASLPTRLRERLAASLTPERLAHVLGVEGMAVTLAARHGLPPEKAMLAALLHDVAKPERKETQREWMEACRDFPPDDEDRRHPKIWHALAGAHVARTDYGITDPDILNAIAWHPTGQQGLPPLGLVLYVSDYLEPSRSFPGVHEQRRRLLPLDLPSAALAVAEAKLRRLEEEHQAAHTRTIRMRDWLRTLAPSPIQPRGD